MISVQKLLIYLVCLNICLLALYFELRWACLCFAVLIMIQIAWARIYDRPPIPTYIAIILFVIFLGVALESYAEIVLKLRQQQRLDRVRHGVAGILLKDPATALATK